MNAIRIFILGLLAACSGGANAELPTETAPQVGFYLTKHFGAQHSVPVEMGARFHYGEVGDNIYRREARDYRPALFDIKFNRDGVTAFETAGVNVMQPRYMLGAEEEGFLSSINWGLVGLALFGVGVYALAEDDRDDRDERLTELEQDAQDGSATGDDQQAGNGAEEGDGGDAGGTTGTPLDAVLDPLAGAAGG